MARTVTAKWESLNPLKDAIDLGLKTVVTIRDEVVDRRVNLTDEVFRQVETLVDRGDALRKQGMKRVNDLSVWTRREVRRQVKTLSRKVTRRMDGMLHAVNLASTGDIEKIQARLDALNAKLVEIEDVRH